MPNLSDLLGRSSKDQKSGRASGSEASAKPRTGQTVQPVKSSSKKGGSLGNMLQPASVAGSNRQQELQREREAMLAAAEQRYKERAAAREVGAAAQQTAQTPGFLAPKNSFTMPGAAAATLGFQQQTQNRMSYQPRSIMDRDSVVQGKVYDGAAVGMQQAEAEGDIYGYIQHLDAAQKAYGNLAQNQEDEWKKKDPVSYYASSMSQDALSRKVNDTSAEIDRLTKEREDAAREQARLEGQYGTEYYNPDEIERLIRLQYTDGMRLETLQNDLPNYQAALAQRKYLEIGQEAREQPDFEEKSVFISSKNGKEEQLHALSGTYTETGYDDLLHDAINGDVNAQNKQRTWDVYAGNGGEYSNWFNLSDEDKKVYNYLYNTGKQDEAKKYVELIAGRNYTPWISLGFGFARGVGALSLTEAAANALGGDERMDSVYQMWGDAQKQNPTAFGVGNIAGNIALMAAGGKIAGAAAKAMGLGGTGVLTMNIGGKTISVVTSPVTTKMATSAMTFALTNAIQNAGSASAGRMTVGEYLGGIGKGAAGGAAGSMASWLVDSGMAALLTDAGWMKPFGEYMRRVYSGVAFSTANIGTQQLLSEDKMDMEECGRQLLSAFLYNIVSSGLETIKTTNEYKAQTEDLMNRIAESYNRFSDTGLSNSQKAELAQNVIDYTQQLKTAINSVYMPGQQAYVNDINAALDGMTEMMTGYGYYHSVADTPGLKSGWSGSTVYAGPAQEFGAPYSGDYTHESGPTVSEVQSELALQIQQGVQDGLQMAQQYPTQSNQMQAPAGGMTDSSMVPTFGGGALPTQGTGTVGKPAASPPAPDNAITVPGPEWDDGSQDITQPAPAEESGSGGQIQAIYEQTKQLFAEQARELDDTTLQAMAENVERNLAETRDSAPSSEVAVMEGQRDALRQEISAREAVNRNGERMEAAARATEVPGPKWNDGSELETGRTETSAPRDGGPVPYGAQNDTRADVGIGPYEGNSGRQSAVPTETGGRIATASGLAMTENENGGQIARATEQEGLSYGTASQNTAAESPADGSQRDAGLGADGQTGSLGESTGGPVARGGRGREIVELLAHVKAVGAEKTSSARLEGLQGGTNNASIYLLSEDMLTDSLREQVEKKAEEGIELRFTLNPIEVRDELGQVHGVNGVQITTADGRQIEYVQANSRKYSPEQIVAHEDFHALLARNPALKRQLIDWLYSNHTEQEISSMVAAYARATRGIYDGKENAVELYFEDMLADFASQMERGDKDAAKARETAGKAFDEFSGEIENARQNRAGIDRTNGPGQRFSIEADTELEEKNITDGSAAVKSLIEQAKTSDDPESLVIENAMYRSDIGYIDLKWGTPGRGAKFKHGYGLAHIIAKRNAEGGNGEAVAYKLVEVIAKATDGDQQSNDQTGPGDERIRLYYDGYTAVLVKKHEENKWLLTGWQNNETAASAIGEVRDSSNATTVTPIQTRRNGDATVSNNSIAQDSENDKGSGKNNSDDFKDETDWIGSREAKQSFSAADEENDGKDWLDGSEMEETAGPSRTPAPTETGERIATAQEGPRNDNAGEMAAEVSGHYEAQAREKKIELAERTGIDGLKSRIENEEKKLEAIKTAEKMGLIAEDKRNETKARKKDIQESIDIYKAELEKKTDAKKADKADKEKRAEKRRQQREEKKALEKEAALKADKPKQSKYEFRQDALNLFSVQAGKRQTLGNILNSFADKMIAQNYVSQEDRADLFRQLYEAGVEIAGPADDTMQDIRDFVKSGRIYVPQEVRNEFGDDWIAFNQQAWGNQIYFTRDVNDRGADSWNAELAEAFPGSFDAGETDARTILENIVDLTEEGKGEHVTIAEMMRRNQAETGVTVDQQMDELESKLDRLIDTFAQKARIEAKTAKRGMMQLVKERQYNREQVERQAQRRREIETRKTVADQVSKLQKMRKRVSPDFQGQIDELIGRLDPDGSVGIKGMYGAIDAQARSISAKGLEDLPALARQYEEYKKAKGEDFLPNAAVEKRINRLKEIQLDSLTLDDVITLGEAVSGLVTQIQNENKLLADERHGAVSASAGKIDTEVKASKGKMFGEKFWAGEMLDMPRYLQHLTGWHRGGEGERFAKLLEKATVDESAYISGADALFDEFKKNKENRDWLKKATGRHAESIEIKVPVDIGKDANGNTAVEWQTFEITPMMRVALLMHSRNYENLRHIAETGIQIPKLDDFRKGKMKDALSGVDPVRMAPSTVKAIVKECTPQERAFADVLAAYFDVYAKERINNVSLVLDGFYRANVEHYFPIDSARDYLGGSNDYVAFDRSLESIGSLKERKNGINPIVLGDALDIASRHMATFARYTAFAIPMRDFNEVFGYVFHEEGKPFAGSVMHTIGKQFGPSGPDSIKQIQAALAQQNPASDEVFMKTLRKIRGRIASASLSGNVRVMASQFASLPYALPYLGAQDLLASFVNPVDTKVRDIYSPISQFRRGGYITQELGDLKSEHPLLNSIPVVMTGITDVDTFTINRLWSAAVQKVYRTTDLKPGSREQVLSGNDDFYKAVAEIYTEAVYKTQPNYTTVQRPALLRDSNDLVRSLLMYKTVPFQVYGMLYEATGRLANDQARYNANKSTENKENLKESRKFYAKTQAAVFIGSTLYVAIRALIGGGLFREKKYRDDEEGKMTLESVAKALGRDLIDTYAGSFVGASELLAIIDKATGNSSYNNKIFNDISSLGEIEKAANVLINSYKAITEKDWQQGRKAIKDAAQEISVLGFGFPAKNIEKFLLSTTKWIAPEWADRYENYFDEYERGDLDEENERFFKASLRVLMDNRTDGLKDETIDELTRLWASDQTAQIPSAIQTSISVKGEDVKLTAAQRESYRELWSKVVSEYLEPLMASDAYEAADDKGKAKLISQLYEYARQQAAAKVAGSEPDTWVLFGQTCEEAGIPLNEYLAVRSTTRKDLQDMDGEALDSAIRGQMEFRVGELDEETLDELAQLFADGGVGAIPPDIPNDVSVNGETVTFSQEERVAWLQSFKRTAGENLEALMASKTYAEADEEGKVKLISGLYEVARAAASMELVPGYSPDKWITTGLEAAEQGVPLDEYVTFHYLANAESKDKDQIQILMKQDWNDGQKETVWTGWLADEGQMRKYENLKNGGASWTDAMGVMDIGGDATEGLTEAQAAVYQQKWESITGQATKALMQTKAYRDANNEGKEAFVDKLNTYASAVARAEALKTTPKYSWVTAGMAAEKAGVKLEQYIVFTVQLGKLDGKDEKGETVDGLENQRGLDLLNKTGWTDKQKEIVYLKSGMTNDSQEEKVKALREAGLTWEQTSSVMRTLGKEGPHARAITATNATEDVKLKALEVYLTESQYKTAKACRAYNIKLDTWLQAKVDADANSNDRVTQEEAEDYIDGLNIGREEKAYLWQLLCQSQKNANGKYPDTWKKNPYSTTWGREVWEYIYGD